MALLSASLVAVLIWAIVDAYASRRAALWSALGIGLGILGLTFLIRGKIESIDVIEFAFIGIFIGIALLKDNDFYFRVAPAIYGVLFAIGLGYFTLVQGRPILLEMVEKYGILELYEKMNAPAGLIEGVQEISVILGKHLPVWSLIHSYFIYLAARHWNKWAWLAVKVAGSFLITFLAIAVALVWMLLT